MTNEEMEKAIEFILGQQAQFYANLNKLEEQQQQMTAIQSQQLNQQEQLLNQQEKILTQQDQLTNSLMGLTSIVGKLAEKYTELTETQNRLAESQEHTDSRLNAVINIIETFFKRTMPPENSPENAQ